MGGLSCSFLRQHEASFTTQFTYCLYFKCHGIYYTNPAQIIGHIKRHFMTTRPLTYVTNGIQEFVKCYIKRWVHLDLQPNNMLFVRLQPVLVHWVDTTGSISVKDLVSNPIAPSISWPHHYTLRSLVTTMLICLTSYGPLIIAGLTIVSFILFLISVCVYIYIHMWMDTHMCIHAHSNIF